MNENGRKLNRLPGIGQNMTESTQTSKLTHRGGRRPSMLRGDHRFLFAGKENVRQQKVRVTDELTEASRVGELAS